MPPKPTKLVMSQGIRKMLPDPNMSDHSLLTTVEDLINRCISPSSKTNVVSFKLLHLVLIILARQLRILQQQVSLHISSSEDEDGEPATKHKEKEKTRHKGAGSKGAHKEDKASAASSPQKSAPSPPTTSPRSATESKEKGSKKKKKEVKEAASVQTHLGPVTDEDDSDYRKKHAKDKRPVTDEDDSDYRKKHAKDKRPVTDEDDSDYRKKHAKDKRPVTDEDDSDYRKKHAKDKRPVTDEDDSDYRKKHAKDKKKQHSDESDHSLEKSEVKTKGADDKKKEGAKGKGKDKEGKGKEAKDHEVQLVSKPSITSAADTRTKHGQPKRGSLEVVTQAQFRELVAQVQELQRIGQPPPMPSLPKNEKLLTDISAGRASLTDTMQAAQIVNRVQASEEALKRLTEMMTELTMRGGLPSDLAGAVAAATSAKPAQGSKATTTQCVSVDDLNEALRLQKIELMKQFEKLLARALSAADSANVTCKVVTDKMETAILLSARLQSLTTLVEDYASQLNGLDSGMETQLICFRGQINEIQADLKQGLAQLSQVNANSETLAVKELTELYDGLVAELDSTLHNHTELTQRQHELNDDLQFLVQRVEMLSEEKMDRDEVLDGLRDKADLSLLEGLLTEVEFHETVTDIRKRLHAANEKFDKQDNVWMQALRDLSNELQQKATMTMAMGMRSDLLEKLQSIADRLGVLSLAVGEPQAALVTRRMHDNATCGPCQRPAHMELKDAMFGKPPKLPALRPPPPEPCETTWQPDPVPDTRTHEGHRWVGGSHTLMNVVRVHGKPLDVPARSTRKYQEFADGLVVMCEEEMICRPCEECNYYPEEAGDEKRPVDGAGDGGDQLASVTLELPPGLHVHIVEDTPKPQ